MYVTRRQTERGSIEIGKGNYPFLDEKALRSTSFKDVSILHPLPRVDEVSPEVDQDRTDQYGKTSAVHFVRFKLNKTQVESFKEDESQVTLHIKHSNYSYSQVLSSLSKISLKHDLNI